MSVPEAHGYGFATYSPFRGPLQAQGIKLLPVRSELLDDAWRHAEPFVLEAVKRGATVETAEGYRAQCAARTAQLWMMVENSQAIGCGITEIYDTAKGLTCAVPILACDRFEALEALFDVLERWAKEQGCVRLEGYGRHGWVRALKPAGWRVVAVCIEKDI